MPRAAVIDRKERHERSRSPMRETNHHGHKRRRSPLPTYDKPLPFSARLLDKHDFNLYRCIFASYLDIQKQKNLDDLPENEAKGRWKSFIRKWNHGELAEGWYDSDRLQEYTHQKSPAKRKIQSAVKRATPEPSSTSSSHDEDDEYGPALAISGKASTRAGPSIPTMSDLALRRENDREDRESTIALAKASRRADAKLEKQRLDDLAPRAEAGTRERQLEKKRDLAMSNKTFAESKGGGATSGMVEITEADLLGGGDEDGIEGIKKRRMEQERKLSERELRREEFARARREEMEQRRNDFTEKEEERTQRFIELAKRRFG